MLRTEILPRQMKVLVVDDSTTVRQRIVTLVREIAGIELVAEARNVAGALDMFERITPDLVILDLNLPGRSGIELLPILKTRVAPLVVVVLTNHAGNEYARRCRELGADYFFDKSKQFQKAIEVVRAARASRGSVPTHVGENPMADVDRRPTRETGSHRYPSRLGVRKSRA
jgi:DNA-binding NarL/FixJ family response regulator